MIIQKSEMGFLISAIILHAYAHICKHR